MEASEAYTESNGPALDDSTIDDIEMSDIDVEVDQRLDARLQATPGQMDSPGRGDADISAEATHEEILPGVSVRWEGDEYTLIPDGIPLPSFASVKLPIDPILDSPRKILQIYEGVHRVHEIVVPNLRLIGTATGYLDMSVRKTKQKLQVQLTEKTTGWHLSFRVDITKRM